MPKKPTSKKAVKPKNITEQSLFEDYWEGYYAVGEQFVAKLTDQSDMCARISVYGLSDGKRHDKFDVTYGIEDTVSVLDEELSRHGFGRLGTRISDSAINPDREEEIAEILARGERFELILIKNLVRTLKYRTIDMMAGSVGGQELALRDYEGFYLLADGKVLYCMNTDDWDLERLGKISDSAVKYYVLDPKRFSLIYSKPCYYGYLVGDRFSGLIESLSKEHGNSVSVLARRSDGLYPKFVKALSGDTGSAAVAGHRTGLDLRVVRKRPL